jgi:predicted dehydrogenase
VLAALPQSVRHTTEAKTAWNDPDIDCIVIATPPSTHFVITRQAMTHHKHVLVEKPMVTSTAESRELEKLVERSNEIFMIGFTYIYNDHINCLKKAIECGALGAVLSMRAEHRHKPERNDINSFWDAAPHPLSVFSYLFNPTNLVKVRLETSTRRLTSATLQFDRGPILRIATESNSPKKIRKMVFDGELQTATLDETRKTKKLLFSRDGAPRLAVDEPLRNELEHFIRCVRSKQQPITNLRFGARVTKWLEEVTTSC